MPNGAAQRRAALEKAPHTARSQESVHDACGGISYTRATNLIERNSSERCVVARRWLNEFRIALGAPAPAPPATVELVRNDIELVDGIVQRSQPFPGDRTNRFEHLANVEILHV